MMRDRLMNWGRLALPMLLVVALGVGCGDDEPTGPDIAILVGTWLASPGNAGTSLLLTPNANPAGAINLVTTLGGNVTAAVTSAERLTFTVNVPALGVNNLVIQGDLELTSSTQARFTNDADPTDVLTLTYGLANNNTRLTVSVQDAELLDLNMDGNVDGADAARLDGIFDKQ